MGNFKCIAARSWSDFRESLLRYAQLSRGRRDELWFRGQGDSDWTLSTTLDRVKPNTTAAERQAINKSLLQAFKNEARHIGLSEALIDSETKLELLARHHGLLSPLMDWTLSPYVAAYFAYASYKPEMISEYVSVWCLDVQQIDWSSRKDIEMLWQDLPVFENRRALQQRGVFLRTAKSDPLEQLIPEYLTRFDLPVTDRVTAMQDLDEMLVNATTMFYDLEGAARTAVFRLTGS